jgi:hypothetical protein
VRRREGRGIARLSASPFPLRRDLILPLLLGRPVVLLIVYRERGVMEIGDPEREIIVEPVEDPVPREEPAEAPPIREPVPERVGSRLDTGAR